MKLQSLKSSKFGLFEGYEVENPLKVSGGAVVKDKTTYKEYKADAQGNFTILVAEGIDFWTWGSDAATHDDRVFNQSGDMTYWSTPYDPNHYYAYAVAN